MNIAYRRICLMLALMVLAGSAAGQSYPTKPVKLVVPFAAGGPVDLVARQVASGMEARLKQPFVIEVRPGANGTIGTNAVAKAPADGYTLLVVSSAFTISPSTMKSLPFDPETSFSPIGLVTKGDLVLVANPSLGVKTVGELIARAKTGAARLKFGSSGYGGSLHLAGELLKLRAGINMIHVPYNGANQVVIDTVGGHVDLGFVSLAPAIELIKSGQLVALAIGGLTRSPALPDVPTMVEAGFVDFDVASTYGLIGPAGLPPDVVAQLSKALQETLADPPIREKLGAISLEPSFMTPAAYGTYIHQQIAVWGQAVKAAGIEAK